MAMMVVSLLRSDAVVLGATARYLRLQMILRLNILWNCLCCGVVGDMIAKCRSNPLSPDL